MKKHYRFTYSYFNFFVCFKWGENHHESNECGVMAGWALIRSVKCASAQVKVSDRERNNRNASAW